MGDLTARARQLADDIGDYEHLSSIMQSVFADVFNELADRVDEQERRIAELERFKNVAWGTIANTTAMHPDAVDATDYIIKELEALSQKETTK